MAHQKKLVWQQNNCSWLVRFLDNPTWNLFLLPGGFICPLLASRWRHIEPCLFNLWYIWMWPFLTHFWQILFDLEYYPPIDLLMLPLFLLLKSNWFKSLLTDFSTATVYSFGSEGWSWDFSLLSAGSYRMESTILRYPCVYSYKRDSYVIRSYGCITSKSHTQSFFIQSSCWALCNTLITVIRSLVSYGH